MIETKGPQRLPKSGEWIPDWLHKSRKSANITQAALAEKLGVSQPQVSFWESGESQPSDETLQKISAILGAELPAEISKAGFDLAGWVRLERERIGLSQSQLAEKASISPLTIYFIERGDTKSPHTATLDKLQKILGKLPGQLSAETKDEATIDEFEYLGPFPISEWKQSLGNDKVPAVYVFYDQLKRPVRIGETDDLVRRMKEYEQYYWFKSPTAETFAYVVVKERSFRRKTEKVMIKLVGSQAIFNIQDKI
jgi:transcriptional regulator with XRE-family HTH domain